MNEDTTGAFEAAYREHYGAVRRYAAQRFGENEADDVAQETMLRAWARFDELTRDGRPLTAWLTKVATDVGIDRRRRQRRVVVDGDAVTHATAAVPDESARVALQADTRPLLKRALTRLSPGERQALALHAVADAGIGEIAAVTGLTANAVRQRLFRARRNLRHHFSELGGHDYAAFTPAATAAHQVTERLPGRWLGRTAELLGDLASRFVPTSPLRPAAALTMLAALLAPPAPPVPDVPPRPPVAAPGGPRLVVPPAVPEVTVPVVTVAARKPLAGLPPLPLPAVAPARSARVEAESVALDDEPCGEGTPFVWPEPGASGLAVFTPASGCGQSFSTSRPRHVSSIRYRVGGAGRDVCGHFEIAGAIVGTSDTVCDGGGTWLLVPVESTAGVGAYTVTWVVDDARGRDWLDAVVDFHMLAPDGAGEDVTQCANGVDDDGDGHRDLPGDPGCAGPLDDDERTYGFCDDGLDNDGDGAVDYRDDLGCGTYGHDEQCGLYVATNPAAMQGNAEWTAECVRTSHEAPAVILPSPVAVP